MLIFGTSLLNFDKFTMIKMEKLDKKKAEILLFF